MSCDLCSYTIGDRLSMSDEKILCFGCAGVVDVTAYRQIFVTYLGMYDEQTHGFLLGKQIECPICGYKIGQLNFPCGDGYTMPVMENSKRIEK